VAWFPMVQRYHCARMAEWHRAIELPRHPDRVWLIAMLVCIVLISAVGCGQNPIERSRDELAQRLQEPVDPQITSDNAGDLLPIVLHEDIQFDYGWAWTEMGESGLLTALDIYGSTDDDEFSDAVMSFYCEERSPLPASWLILRLYQWDPVNEKPTFPTVVHQTEDELQVNFGLLPEARWRSWGLAWLGSHIELADATNFLREAKRHNELRIRVPLPGRVAEAKFRLLRALNTPIQPNLDWCGAY